MERIHGRSPHNPQLEKKLSSILFEPAKFTLSPTIPFYMYLGSVDDYSARYITLRMLSGSTIHEFEREALNYCSVQENSIAYTLLRDMTTAFFTIVQQGFIPRDIEFVLNGNKGNTLITILDFNEVKTIAERSVAVDSYIVEEDIANVYIDLCGLRREKTQGVNPQAPYDFGTPQWKFLCSPMTAPGAFLAIARSMPAYTAIFERILRGCIRKRGRTWVASGHVFSQNGDPAVFMEFDSFFQEYIVNMLIDTCRKKGLQTVDIPDSYTECILFLNHQLQYKPVEIDSWGELF